MKLTVTRSASHIQDSGWLFPTILGLRQELKEVFTCMSMHVRSGYSCSKTDFPEIIAFIKTLMTPPGHLLRGILIGKCT